jgi:phthiocerol/phenolphthiocerol synthesis type-I polyketide synthase E
MTPTQEAVALAYAEALEIEGVGLDDDIFSLGGDSLHAVRIALKLQRVFAIEVPPELMEEPITVRAAAAWIDARLAEMCEE